MKSLNVKKIASVAVGAAMVGAAFAGATSHVEADAQGLGNYEFFSNGEPNFKIVVGANAQISDAVAAGNLAAMVGNLAYSDGASTPSTGGSTTGGVTGKSVTLEVTAPAGATGQTGQTDLMTQLYDFLDVSQITATMTRVNGASTLVGDGVTTGGYKISSITHPTVAYSGTVSGLGTYVVKQEDTYFVTARSYYDTTDKVYVGDQAQITQVVNFTDAIPFHVDVVNGTTENRPTNDAYLTANRNVHIQFLGQDYVITTFSNGTASADPAIKLGKAAIFRQVKPGESVTIGDKTLKLVSVSPIAVGSSTLPPAYFELIQNGTRLDYFSMDKNTADYNKNSIILDVRDVFVGSGDTSYAEIALYSTSVSLTSGQKISFEGDDALTKQNDEAGWTASLTFDTKNVGGYVQKTLKTIQLSGRTSSKIKTGDALNMIANPTFKRLTYLGLEVIPSDTLTITARGTQSGTAIAVPASGDNSRSGRNLDVNLTEMTSAYDNAFEVSGTKTVKKLLIDEYNGRIYYQDPAATSDSANYTAVGIQGNVVTYAYPATKLSNALALITTGQRNYTTFTLQNVNSSASGWTDALSPRCGDLVAVTYTDTAGGESQMSPTHNSSGSACQVRVANVSWGAVTGAAYYTVYVVNVTGAFNYSSYPTAQTQLFVGNNVSSGVIANTTTVATSGTVESVFKTRSATLRIFEPDTDNSPSTLNAWTNVDLYQADASYLFNSSSTTSTLTLTFRTAAAGVENVKNLNTTFEQGFYTPFGTKYESVGLSEVKLKYPQRIIHAKYQFGAPSTVNVTAAGTVTTTKPLNEAETYNIGNGYSVKINAIGGTCSTTCTAGGSSGGSVVTELNPSENPIVVLDSEADSGQLIVVGGPLVNTVAAGTPGAEVASTPGTAVVRVLGNNVLVAGYTAADTRDAVNALIDWLASNRDEVRNV